MSSLVTLTDFLLARIAEDEAWAHKCIERDDLSRQLEHRVNGVLVSVFASPAEALTILADQRRLIDQPASVVDLDAGTGDPNDWPRLFASAYADHPDYRQEWKP